MRFHFLVIGVWAILAFAALDAEHAAPAPTSAEIRKAVRAYREQREPAIVNEFAQLLAIPNHASDTANIRKNAELIARSLRDRQVETRLLEFGGGPPVVFGKVDVPGATRMVTFYAHYDGQPTGQAGWTVEPFQPRLRGPDGSTIDLAALPQRLDPQSRLFARSASDDKAPIIATLAALDALRASRWQPGVNLRFFFEGEEEVGSPHLAALLKAYESELKTDLWIICDGPVHQDGKKLFFFGVRGATGVDITVYGPNRGLHSGHYGNWAPNPIVLLTHLLDSMRHTQARILIPGFYDDVRAPTAAELLAAGEMPNYDAQIKRNLGLVHTEGEPASLQTQIMLPALNVRGIAGGAVGDAAANVIVPEATASIDFRLVPDQTPAGVRRRVEQHVQKQGYFIVRQPPDEATRLAHPLIARLSWEHEGSYPTARTPLDNPRVDGISRKPLSSAFRRRPPRRWSSSWLAAVVPTAVISAAATAAEARMLLLFMGHPLCSMGRTCRGRLQEACHDRDAGAPLVLEQDTGRAGRGGWPALRDA